MTENHIEPPLNLSALKADNDARAAAVATRALARIAEESNIRLAVRQRLARLAWPAALAAAASVTLLVATTRESAPSVEPLAELVVGQSPAARWVAYDTRPSTGEIIALIQGRP